MIISKKLLPLAAMFLFPLLLSCSGGPGSTLPAPTDSRPEAPTEILSGALPGNREGNGGDHIRATFIKVGMAVIHFLETTEVGSAIVKAEHLELGHLQKVLDIEKIKVVDGSLKDNSGSEVDAKVEKGILSLKGKVWYEHFERDRDIYYLVFHEMLRLIETNDDNYRISNALNPFPWNYRVLTRIQAYEPITGAISRFIIVDPSQIEFTGEGCTWQNTFLDLDPENSTLTLSFSHYAAPVGCHIKINIQKYSNWRIRPTQIDLSGRTILRNMATTISLSSTFANQAGADTLEKGSARYYGNSQDTSKETRFLLRQNPHYSVTTGGLKPQVLELEIQPELNKFSTIATKFEAEIKIERLTIYFETVYAFRTEGY